MIQRYAIPQITQIFCDEHKLKLWQDTELALIQAMAKLEKFPGAIYAEIASIWLNNPIDIEWWKKHDEEIHHDLNAFLDERYRFLPNELHCYVHKNITSYDTEESPFAIMLKEAVICTNKSYHKLRDTLADMAIKYRYTVMNARTHGQEAEIQSFGARILTWYQDLKMAKIQMDQAAENLQLSKLSGAIGKYGSIDPEIEKETLRILGLTPYYGATQIIPRILYAPLAQSLSNLVAVIDKIATDIRLSARSGRVLMQEPFKKKQKGSTAMPHKKNPISLEQIEGLNVMAQGYALMIGNTIKTWEERAIHQSSVERVAWPDLFHVTVRAINVLNKTLKGLKVYPDNMYKEIIESRGVYASSEVKEFLKEHLVGGDLAHEDIYRIVQLAAFTAFKPNGKMLDIRETIPQYFMQAEEQIADLKECLKKENLANDIERVICYGKLEYTDDLDISLEQVIKYNKALKKLFDGNQWTLWDKWRELFTPSFLLKNEYILFQEILGV